MHALKHNKFKYFDSLNTAILFIDQNAEVSHLNCAAEEFLQISSQQIIGKSITSIFENSELIKQCLNRLKSQSGPIIINEIAINTAQNKRKIVSCSLNPILNDNDSAEVFASIEIISENRFSILDLKPDLKPNVTGNSYNLLQGMAHEIKNPLGGIRGAAQLLSKNLKLREDKDYINIIINETDRLNHLVDRMSGHIKNTKMLPINIHRILEHVYKIIKAENEDTLIKRDYDPSLPKISGSDTALTQAFLNLVLNALQAIKTKAQIIIRTRMEYGVVIKDKQHRQALRIDIQDNGVGIDQNIRETLFEPLISSKPQGTGIGLAITREVILMHQGKITFSSEPGKTVFSVFFPVLAEK